MGALPDHPWTAFAHGSRSLEMLLRVQDLEPPREAGQDYGVFTLEKVGKQLEKN